MVEIATMMDPKIAGSGHLISYFLKSNCETKNNTSAKSDKKQGSGLSLLHLMFMLFLTLLRNMIIQDLTPYVAALSASDAAETTYNDKV